MRGIGGRHLAGALILALALTGCGGDAPKTEDEWPPLVIAHRGASGYLPEHTIEAYKLALEQGADFIEPDLVMTRDGILIARHDPYLSDSTDIADRSEFADRKTTITSPEGQELTDWFVWDFTLDEIRTLRTRQVRPGRDTSCDHQFSVAEFSDVLDLVTKSCTVQTAGLYPETKWPSHHEARGLDMAKAIETALTKARERNGCLPEIYVQSFEAPILKTISQMDTLASLRLVQLVFPLDWTSAGTPSYSLEELATYADGVGPYKALMIDQVDGTATGYGAKAAALGLEIHPWTLRDDDISPAFDTIEAEIISLLDAGATGFFTDFPDTGRFVADKWLLDRMDGGE